MGKIKERINAKKRQKLIDLFDQKNIPLKDLNSLHDKYLHLTKQHKRDQLILLNVFVETMAKYMIMVDTDFTLIKLNARQNTVESWKQSSSDFIQQGRAQ